MIGHVHDCRISAQLQGLFQVEVLIGVHLGKSGTQHG